MKLAPAQNPIEFFTSHGGFTRLLAAMANTYARHGRAFGAVRLVSPSAEEEKAISEFFGRDYFDQALIRISLGDFERRLTKVSDIDLAHLLAKYTDANLEIRNTTDKDSFADALQTELLPSYRFTRAESWLNDVSTHMRRTYKPWVKKYATEPHKVLSMVNNVAQLINNLPMTHPPMYLSDFVAKYTNTLQVIDFNSEYEALFLRALAHSFETSVPHNINGRISLYLKAGLLTGGVVCQVTVQGIISSDIICTFYNSLNQAHVLTLENILHLSDISAYNNKVFIIDNPLMFSAVSEQMRGTACTLISSMGNHNPAFFCLLDLFCNCGDVSLYYSGNMDYKGLAFADKLHLQFGKQFIPWRYSKPDYELIIEQSSSLLPDERKDLAMHNEDLALILSQIRKTGKIASSLPLVPHLVSDIKKETQEVHHEK